MIVRHKLLADLVRLWKNESWVYVADSGEWVRSYGTEATMPVYKASVEIMQNVRRIAKEVFSA